jgi:hypothetical protein
MLITLNAGSSQHGKHRRASAASNCVTAMFLDSPLHTYLLKKMQPERNKRRGHFIQKNSKIMCIWHYSILQAPDISIIIQCSLVDVLTGQWLSAQGRCHQPWFEPRLLHVVCPRSTSLSKMVSVKAVSACFLAAPGHSSVSGPLFKSYLTGNVSPPDQVFFIQCCLKG